MIIENQLNENQLNEKHTEDERLGYSKRNRFIIAGICLITIIISYVCCSESGNFVMTDLEYSYPNNFRLYVDLIRFHLRLYLWDFIIFLNMVCDKK